VQPFFGILESLHSSVLDSFFSGFFGIFDSFFFGFFGISEPLSSSSSSMKISIGVSTSLHSLESQK